MIPKPDLRPLENHLTYLKRNISKALPVSRLCSKTDAIAYHRAATHLANFKVKNSTIFFKILVEKCLAHLTPFRKRSSIMVDDSLRVNNGVS